MRFRMSERPPAHLDRPLQYRLLGWVSVIAVVLIVVQVFRSEQTSRVPQRPQPEALDFSVQQDSQTPLAPDEFLAVSTDRQPSSSHPEGLADPQIDKSLLDQVRDNTLGIRHYEADAFYTLLDHVRRIPQAAMEQAVIRDALYVNLMTDPAKYRGELVQVVGELWRCYELPVPPNRYGIERLYEGWVFTPDSGTHPYRIVTTQLGEGIRVGENLRTPVRLIGYFFKREGYETPAGLHVAPTILAKRISQHRLVQAPPRDDLAPLMLGVVIAIGLILAVTLIALVWSDHKSRLPRSRDITPSSLETLASLEGLETRSVEQTLRELSERDRFGESSADRLTQPSSNGHLASDETPSAGLWPSSPRRED